MFYEPAKGHGLPHDPFKAIVAPRPIGWISTRSNDGALNLASYPSSTRFRAGLSGLVLAWVVTGEVIGIHIDEAVMTNGLFGTVKAGNVARLGYMDGVPP